MSAVPSSPEVTITWSLGVVVLLVAGLALVALVAVISVLLAAERPFVVVQRLKSFAGMMLWIVPALAVVGLIGVNEIYRIRVAETQSATVVVNPSANEAQPTGAPRPAAIQNASLPDTSTGQPDWAGTPPVVEGNRLLVPVSSQQWATRDEARQQLTELATKFVKEHYQNECPLPGNWNLPPGLVEEKIARQINIEVIDKDFGNGIRGNMYRAHVRLDLDERFRDMLRASWHDRLVVHRLTWLGSLLSLVTVVLGSAHGYFRLDDLTGGRYGRRLKLAAGALIAACGLTLLIVARSA